MAVACVVAGSARSSRDTRASEGTDIFKYKRWRLNDTYQETQSQSVVFYSNWLWLCLLVGVVEPPSFILKGEVTLIPVVHGQIAIRYKHQVWGQGPWMFLPFQFRFINFHTLEYLKYASKFPKSKLHTFRKMEGEICTFNCIESTNQSLKVLPFWI